MASEYQDAMDKFDRSWPQSHDIVKLHIEKLETENTAYTSLIDQLTRMLEQFAKPVQSIGSKNSG